MSRLAPILLGLLAFGLAACGGDDPPSQEEFADRADEICREAERALQNVGESAETPQEIADAVGRVIEESRNALDELADLERPEGDAGETAEQFVDATRTEIQDEGIPALEDLRDAVESEDQEAVQAATERLQGINAEASNRAARALGADECAEG